MNDSSFDIKFVDWLIVWLIDWLLVTLIISWLAHNMPATLQHFNTATFQQHCCSQNYPSFIDTDQYSILMFLFFIWENR